MACQGESGGVADGQEKQLRQGETSDGQEDSSHSRDIETLVQRLNLKPHPEGGYFSETWRGNRKVLVADPQLASIHDLGTNIYYLLRRQDKSVWHRLKQAEIFYWHAGGRLKVHTIDNAGVLKTSLLGDVLKYDDCRYEAYMEPMTWMALEPTPDSPFVLIGDAVFPGFEYSDWELGKASEMKKLFPQHADIIDRLAAPEG